MFFLSIRYIDLVFSCIFMRNVMDLGGSRKPPNHIVPTLFRLLYTVHCISDFNSWISNGMANFRDLISSIN